MQKNNEPLIVEVHCGRLASQLQEYRKLGRVILVLPIDVQGIQLWGMNELEAK